MEKQGMNMRPMKRRRMRYFIGTRFQFKFVGMILLFMLFVAITSAAIVYYNIWALLGEKLANVYPQGRLVNILNTANGMFMVRILLLIPAVIVFAIMVSHRIVGPKYRMKKTLDDVAGGNYALRLRLRKTDELKDVAEAMNNVVELLDKKDKKHQK